MSAPRTADRVRAWVRSFSVHGTWNHRTLLGAGLAYALLPVLRRVHAGDPVAMREALERHLRTFNAHPYLASAAVGALARLEADDTDDDTLDRFRNGLSGPLGSLGDRVVWSGWRPFCALAAATAYLAGAPAIWAAGGFVLLYNAGHVLLRGWGFLRGWEEGLALGGELRGPPLSLAPRILEPLSAVLVGAVAALLGVVAVPATGGSGTGAALLAAGITAGHVWPSAARKMAPAALAAAFLVAWLAG